MNYHTAKAFILNKLNKELSTDLTYHGLHHTLDVLHRTEELCYFESINPHSRMLLKTAALYHDSGFIISNKEHEKLGCSIAKKHLPRFGYQENEIRQICGMIMATKIPQSPKNYLESILCDADLDYLGREDFYDIGRTLFQELKAYDILHTEEAWNNLQVKFLEQHRFFTTTNKNRRQPQKAKHLEELKKKVKTYKNI